MIKFIFFIISVFAGTCLSAQTAAGWDSTYRPGRWQQRVDNFKSYPDSKKDIIFLGNSITEYTEWNELLQNKHVKNRGISGDISFGVLERIGEVTEGKPKKVFILIGINDISRNIPDSILLNNFRRIIDSFAINSPSTKIYFNSILPVNNTFPPRNHFGKDAHIAAVNNGLSALCRERNIIYIDAHQYFSDTENKLKKEFTYDGLHLNAAGYVAWANLLKPHLK